MKTILLVGAGNMGFSMLKGWVGALGSTYRFVVVDPAAGPRCAELKNPNGTAVAVAPEVSELSADLNPAAVIFATKPGGVCGAVEALRAHLIPETVLVSVAAGLQISDIAANAPTDQPIVRVMPNIGALIGESASAGFSSSETPGVLKALVAELFQAIGHFTWLASEEDMHTVTAVSGSGPAYFFAMCEAMIAAAMENGLSREVAATLVNATCVAAGGLIAETPDPELLRKRVTSPGGTTAAGLQAFATDDALQSVITSAVDAARNRSIAMA